MNKDNYDQLIRGMDPDFYRNLNEQLSDIEDSTYVLTAVAGAINTDQTRFLDCSLETVRKILAGNNDTVQQCFLRYVVFYKMAECASDVFDRFFLYLLAYFSFYPFDIHHAVVGSALKKVLEIPPEEVPHWNVFVAELTTTIQRPVFSKFDQPWLYFDARDIDERGMENKYKVYLQQLRNMKHRNRQRVVFNTLQISNRDDYPEDQYTYEYIPPQEFLTSYDRYRKLYCLDYDFDYKITRDLDGNLMVLHEPRGMEFRIRLLPDRGDHNLPSCIFHLLDSVLSTIRGSHLASIDTCFSFVFRTNAHNCFTQKMILSLSASLSSSCPALKKVLSDGRMLLSERGHREFSLCVENTAFPIVEGQLPIF